MAGSPGRAGLPGEAVAFVAAPFAVAASELESSNDRSQASSAM
jgi:hypothetical protein